MPSDSRIHYVITDGGDAPNIVPEFAEVYYYVRNPDPEVVKRLFERVVNAANAAALGTGTRMEYEVMHGNYPVLPNEVLARQVDANLRKLGGFDYSPEERKFAESIYETLIEPSLQLVRRRRYSHTSTASVWGPPTWRCELAVPTVGLGTATYVPGTAGTVGRRWRRAHEHRPQGMLLAARVLAMTATDLYRTLH